MAFTTPRTWTYGETVTEAQFNEQIRDNFNAVWVGTTAGDIDYYTSSTTKTRLAGGTANALKYLQLDSGGTALQWNGANPIIGRQGGSADNWETGGTTNYTPTSVIMQVGMAAITLINQNFGDVSITFPVAFSGVPLVFTTAEQNKRYTFSRDITTTKCTIGIGNYESTMSATQYVRWLAIGPA